MNMEWEFNNVTFYYVIDILFFFKSEQNIPVDLICI